MAIEPAAISASPAVMMMPVASTAPDSPADNANGTVRPSDMPMTTSRTTSDAVKCFSTCGACGRAPSLDSVLFTQVRPRRPPGPYRATPGTEFAGPYYSDLL